MSLPNERFIVHLCLIKSLNNLCHSFYSPFAEDFQLLLKPGPGHYRALKTWTQKILGPEMQMQKKLDAEKRLDYHIV